MAKCLIAIKNKNGSIDSIYCQHYGFPLGVGAILVSNYVDVSQTQRLIQKGDINYLGDTLDECDRKGQYGNAYKFSSMSKFTHSDPYGYGHAGTQFGYVQDAVSGEWSMVDFSTGKNHSLKTFLEEESNTYA